MSEDFLKPFSSMFSYLNDHVSALNNSKFFAGLMIILLNISSKFVTIRLSKTMESYLKYTFSRNILVFAIAWMGTRDIYIAAAMVLAFVIVMDYLLNENSVYCCLPEQFMDYHISLLEENNDRISDDDIQKATDLLERAKKQRENDKNAPKTKPPLQTQQGISTYY